MVNDMDVNFQDLRHDARLSRAACAEYLGVNVSTVNRWDNGKVAAPFAVCELMRVIGGKLPALSLRRAFDGWTYSDDAIFTPEGDSYTPEDIRSIFIMRQQLRFYRDDVRKLTEEVKRLTADGSPIMASNVIKFPSFDKTLKQG